ncbi:hypothetical protein DFH28DRAFT_1121005 [Melampsora americana]|nr:hypothetical protein DFH28DRAFT_1121005 [Melampsora americana]
MKASESGIKNNEFLQGTVRTASTWSQIATGFDRSQVNSIHPVPETPLERSLTSGLSLRPGGTGLFSVALRRALASRCVDFNSVPLTFHGKSVTGTVLSSFVAMSHVGTPPSPSEAEGIYPLV